MPIAGQGNPLSTRHRNRQLALRAATLRDMLVLWRAVNPTNLADTIGPFALAAATIVQARFRDSGVLAVRFLRDFHEAEGNGGTVTAIAPDPPARKEASGLLRGAALSGIINARRRGFSPDAAARNGFVKVSGSASNLVLGGSRIVLTEATGRYRRVAGGGACDFCKMLEGRGAVYSARSSDFTAHDHCACSAEPVFR